MFADEEWPVIAESELERSSAIIKPVLKTLQEQQINCAFVSRKDVRPRQLAQFQEERQHFGKRLWPQECDHDKGN
jgi:hypothetical protein